jgi:hypothetical protein
MVRLPILALLAAATFAVAGCGGGSSTPEGTPPSEWAQSVCGALADWQASLQEKSQSLSSEVLQAKSPKAAKEQIGVFLGDVIAETDTMIGAVTAAGQPAVDQGGQIAEDFHNGLVRMQNAFKDAASDVQSVPTDDPQAFQQQLTQIGQELQTQGQAIGDTLGQIDDKYDAAELNQAFEDTPACKDFTAASSG